MITIGRLKKKEHFSTWTNPPNRSESQRFQFHVVYRLGCCVDVCASRGRRWCQLNNGNSQQCIDNRLVTTFYIGVKSWEWDEDFHVIRWIGSFLSFLLSFFLFGINEGRSRNVLKILARQQPEKSFHLSSPGHHMSGCIDFNRLREKGNCWAWSRMKICLMRFFVCASSARKGEKKHKKLFICSYVCSSRIAVPSLMLPEFYFFSFLHRTPAASSIMKNSFWSLGR